MVTLSLTFNFEKFELIFQLGFLAKALYRGKRSTQDVVNIFWNGKPFLTIGVWYSAAVSIFLGMVVYYWSDGVDGGILSWGRFIVLEWFIC